MQNNVNSETNISLATYLCITGTLLISFIITGAICLETGNEITGLVLMLIGVLALAIFNSSTRINGE